MFCCYSILYLLLFYFKRILEMRLCWCILLFSVIGLIHTLDSKEDSDKDIDVSVRIILCNMIIHNRVIKVSP